MEGKYENSGKNHFVGVIGVFRHFGFRHTPESFKLVRSVYNSGDFAYRKMAGYSAELFKGKVENDFIGCSCTGYAFHFAFRSAEHGK